MVMKELIEYRQKVIDRLAEAAGEFRHACESVKDPFAVMDGEWTLHQIASHVRDVNQLVYGERILKTLNENQPTFGDFNSDKWMATYYNRDEPLGKILGEFMLGIENLCKMLQALPNEAWSRESTHEMIGDGLTLQLWVERSLAHIEEHLAGIKKAGNISS